MKLISVILVVFLALPVMASPLRFWKVMDNNKILRCVASHNQEPNWVEITREKYVQLKESGMTEEQKLFDQQTAEREKTIKQMSEKLGISVKKLKGVIK